MKTSQWKARFKSITALFMTMMMTCATPVLKDITAQTEDDTTTVYAEQMMDDFLAVYLRDHYDSENAVAGKSTWRWSNNPDNGGGLTQETRRETDFWLSALVFDGLNDAFEATKAQKYKALMDDLYESFMDSKYHPTWDVHVWTDNTYNDDLCWWTQAFLRTYQLTGDGRYLETATAIFDAVLAGWDAENTGFGGAPYGGVFWRRSAGGVVIERTSNQKNVCTNANAALIAARFAKLYVQTDAGKSAGYQVWAQKIYDWAYAHLYKDKTVGLMIDNINYNGGESATQFTYNYGLFAGASYELYTLTGEARYLTDARKVLAYGWETLTLSDGLTVKDEGQGDSAGFKSVLVRQTDAMVKSGLFPEFEQYLIANAVQAWRHRRLSDGLCGPNLAFTPKYDTGIAGPCALLGPSLLFYTKIDPTQDRGYDLIDWADGENGVYQAEWAANDYIQMDSSQAGYGGTGYTQYWDADGPHREDGFVRFDVTVAPGRAGLYRLDFRWFTRGDNTRRIRVNDAAPELLRFTAQEANRWESVPYYADLKEGINTVAVMYYNKNTHPAAEQDIDSWLFLDSLTVEPVACRLEAAIADGKVTASLTNDTRTAQTGTFYLAIYDDTDGTLAYAETVAFNADAGATALQVFAVEAAQYPTAGYTYRVFCWDTAFAPLTAPCDI